MPIISGGTIIEGDTEAAIPSLTATAGTTDNAVADVGAAFAQAVLNDNFRDLTAKVNLILAALRAQGIIAS